MQRLLSWTLVCFFLFPLIAGAATAPNPQKQLTIFYGNDVRGETEPCG